MPGIERNPEGMPMRATIAGFVVLSAVLIPALLILGTPDGSGGSGPGAGGFRAVTFYVA